MEVPQAQAVQAKAKRGRPARLPQPPKAITVPSDAAQRQSNSPKHSVPAPTDIPQLHQPPMQSAPQPTPTPGQHQRLLDQRPYLHKRVPHPPNQNAMPSAARLDVTKLLSSPAPVTWGGLLGALPADTITNLVAEARRINQECAPNVPAAPEELAAVHATLAQTMPLPQNMFAPFTIVRSSPNGKCLCDPQPLVHWGNVDTGSMINIVYQGVVSAFADLAAYTQPFQHVVHGVGGKVTQIVAKLVGVPISLGAVQATGTLFRTDFYVLDNEEYHWILGLPLLQMAQGVVSCKPRTLQFQRQGALQGQTTTLALITREESIAQPVRTIYRQACPKVDAELLQADEWGPMTLVTQAAQYLGAELAELVGKQQLAIDQHDTLACHPQAAILTARPPVLETGNVQWLAQLQAVAPPDPTQALEHHIATACLAATRESPHLPSAADVYGPRKPRKGRPLPTVQLQKQLQQNCSTHVVVTGPDYIGVTTLLRQLEQKGHHIVVGTNQPPAELRSNFQMDYFQHLLEVYQGIVGTMPAQLLEDSPWAYLCKHAVHIPPAVRSACHALLAPLQPPHLTIILHCSGIEVGRRHPILSQTPELHAPVSLQQMQQLQLHHGATIFIDATSSPSAIANRAHFVINRRLFHVGAAAIEGMAHLEHPPVSLSTVEADQFARQLQLTEYTLDSQGMQRLQRLALVCQLNPQLVNTDLPQSVQARYYQVAHNFIHAFALDLADISSPAEVAPFHVHTFGDPAHRPPIRLSPAHAKFVRSEIMAVKNAGLARNEHTPWAAPCFPVPKPHSDKQRLVIDFRALNLQTRRSSFPLPHIKDIVRKVGQWRSWTKLDLKSGFWQVLVDDNSIAKLGCCTPEELFVWTRMPFGVRNGPPHFQAIMNQVIVEDNMLDDAGCFVDDVATGGPCDDEHALTIQRTRALLQALAKRALKAGADKVFMGLLYMTFLGFLLENGQVKPDPDKVTAIKRLVPPETRSHVRAFLGLTGYYREFVERYAHIARPLAELLKEDVRWVWTASCQLAFDKLKQALVSSPVLAVPEADRPFTVHTDFSHVAVAAVLEQRQRDNKQHVVCYASRHCTKEEARLGPTDGELLAIVYACEKFHTYLAGSKFVLVTDHQALVHLHNAKTKNAKLARWAMHLANYDFCIKHRPGRVHSNADGLSRCHQLPPDQPSPPDSLQASWVEHLFVPEQSHLVMTACSEHDPSSCIHALLATLLMQPYSDLQSAATPQACPHCHAPAATNLSVDSNPLAALQPVLQGTRIHFLLSAPTANEASTGSDYCTPLVDALDAFEADAFIDGDGYLYALSVEAAQPDDLPAQPIAQGPRQMLLEHSPCTACNQHLPPDDAATIICDRCNCPYHLRCTSLRHLPPTYWYCKSCHTHILARGIQDPTEDLALQQYLLDGTAPAPLKPAFQLVASSLTFTTRLYIWRNNQWVNYPPHGLRLLLMEEAHVQHHHVGSSKLYELLRSKHYWPHMLSDCKQFVVGCFECQLHSGQAHGSWQGQLLPLPPGPRLEWSLDLITSLGTSDTKCHLLTAIDCFSKYCLLSIIPDKSSSTVAAVLKDKLFTVFGPPLAIRTDNGTEFKGEVDHLCATYRTKHKRSSPYTSHSQGVIERLHLTVETLLGRCLVSLPPAHWQTLVPELQLTLNVTYARSIGCSPYLLMFGMPPPSTAAAQVPDPTTTTLADYALAVQRQIHIIHDAALTAHAKYRRAHAIALTPDPLTTQLQPGKLAMIIRPKSNKLLTANAGPFLITRLEAPHVWLQSLTQANASLKENVKNVRALHIPSV